MGDISVVPAFGDGAVTIVFATDMKFLGYCGVALQSILDCASPENKYDILIMEAGLSEAGKRLLASQAAGRPNILVRFVNVAAEAERYRLRTFKCRTELSLAAFFRLLIPEIFSAFQKVLYLDCDIVALVDVAELFRAELHGNAIGAVVDMGIHIGLSPVFEQHIRNTLGMRHIGGYFNSGVLLMEIPRIRERDMFGEFLRVAGLNITIAEDQDILNVVCEGSVEYFDPTWNCLCISEERLINYGIDKNMREYVRHLENAARIVHYVETKPDAVYNGELSIHWYQCARKTPWYEMLLINGMRREIKKKTPSRFKRWSRKLRRRLGIGKYAGPAGNKL